VHGTHHVRPGQGEDVGVAAQVPRVVAESLAPKVGLLEAVALDQGPGGAVEDEDALLEQRAKQLETFLACSGDPGPCGGRAGRESSFGGPASFWRSVYR
jgi:hypothetical protein